MRSLSNPNNKILLTKHDAFQYQRDAFEAIKDLDYAAIFHEQGLGKSKIAIDLMLYWIEKREIDTILIVTKKQLVKNWLDEFDIHTYIKPFVLDSNRGSNFYVLNSACRVVVTNFETISCEKDRIKLFLQTRNVAIIVDESTKLKNPDSKITASFFELASYFKIRIIMTGTPVANRPYDIWSQIYFLDFGKALGDNFSQFKNDNNLTNDLYDDNEKQRDFENCVASIFAKIKSFTVRETKSSGIISLPEKVIQSVLVSFKPQQKLMYDKVRKEAAILVQKNDDIQLDESNEILKRLLRLIQISSNPLLIDDLYCEISAKEEKLNQIISNIIAKKEKVIVWSSFIENIEYFYKKFSSYNPIRIHGSLSIDERNKNITKFKKDDSCMIMFATPQAAKEGLTLTVANNVVFYDRGFNLDDYLQAQDRIHRISQTKTCYIYNLMVDDSIDIWIDALLEAKQNAAFLAQGDIELSKYRKISNYDYGSLIKNILEINGGEDF